MTNINIAINGLGRIGKLLLRELIDRDMNVSLVNEVKGDDAMQQDMARGKIAIEKKKVMLKKQAMQKQLQQKTLKLKRQAKVGGVKQDADIT